MLGIHSLKYRIAISIFVLEALMITIVLSNTLTYTENMTREQLGKNEDVLLSLLSDMSKMALFSTEYNDLQQNLGHIVQDPRVLRILVADMDKRVVVSNSLADIGQPMPSLVNSQSEVWRTRQMPGYGSIAIQFSNGLLQAEILKAKRRGLSIALSCMIAIAVAGILFGFLLTRKLAELTEAATQFAEGNYHRRISIGGKDEIAVLSNTYNKMAEKIQQNFHNLELQKSELKQAKEELEQRVEERTKELSIANQKLQRLSEIDTLTNIPNRRRFDNVFEKEWSDAVQVRHPLSLMIIDIDHFKMLNDTYGHQYGDECIREVAGVIEKTKREQDILARYGGEEFTVISPNTTEEGIFALAQRMRKNVERCPFKKCQITISIGVATIYPDKEGTPQKLLEVADQALYEAKKSGRNKVVLYRQALSSQIAQTS